MSRESQILRRNFRKQDLKDTGVPLTREQHVLYLMAQRQLIGFLSERLAILDPNRSQTDCECLVATIISETYYDWFQEQVNVLLEEQFINLYKGMHGPRNLFKALFPGEEIDDFLKKHVGKTNTESSELIEAAQLSAFTRFEINGVIENGISEEASSSEY